ncbi:helix-turn-helix domain-containing protein [Natronomonas salina]|uniref:helix-turn-helix domain-containing protein n=1 Tax=Natronomonas salina TaxID=1710540 RepID=UPI0015B672E8|nr:helix-turn-helix domain-containing protein [Natronomonas salina]QLD91056.1 helix-turn-helix domain-containing protein [Natronomonas salina]
MPLAQLSVDLPEGTWIRDVSTDHPEATVRVLAAMPGDDGVGFALLQVTAPEMEAVVRAMAEHPAMTDLEPLQRSGQQVIVQIETTAPLLLLSAQASRIPIEPPVVIQDGVANVEVRASNDRLSELGDQLEAFGHSFTVDAIHDEADPEQLLSPRQRDLLLSAVEAGYYDTPRECSLTQLAEDAGIAKSTCSETLHRAEGLVVRRFVERHLVAPERVRENDHPGPEAN